ncbi:MAG: SEC-C metal-binding domain-containing protein, partial [Vulcanimicrobiaceae bacterium]
NPADWDLPEMLAMLELIFPVSSYVKLEDLNGKDREELRKVLLDAANAAYAAKEQEITPEIMRVVEQRYLLLPIIDRQWMDHLYVMDHLKTGIGLRGYGQKDPRVEYEKEAYEIFEGLKTNIADEAVRGVFRVTVEMQQQQEQGQQFEAIPSGSLEPQPAGRLSEAEAQSLLGPIPGARERRVMHENIGGEGEPNKPMHRDQPKVGRNDLCPCGSGKKFKKCHGTAA